MRFHPLSKFPGPRFAAISRIPLTWAVFKGKSYDYTDRVHERYGPIVRVGPTELTIRTSAAWKDIYMHRPQIQKESANQTQPVNRAQSLLTADEQDHPRQRRILSHAFSDKAIREQEQLIQPYFHLLISRVRRDAEMRPGRKVDISKWFNYITLDVMGDLSFGESFHLLENDEENSWVTDLFLHTRYGHVTANLSSFPLLHWIVSSFFLKLAAAKRGLARNLPRTEGPAVPHWALTDKTSCTTRSTASARRTRPETTRV